MAALVDDRDEDLFCITPEERALIPSVRERVADLPDPDNHLDRDEDVVRFLRARNNSVDDAVKMLRWHLQWRAKERHGACIAPHANRTGGTMPCDR